MDGFELGLMLVSLVIWMGLFGLRGQFWRTDQQLEMAETKLKDLPAICAVIPARNEADLLPITLRSLLSQDYPGSVTLFLVDDHSTDGTAEVAKDTAQALAKDQQLEILAAKPLPPGWTGKLWAIEQGIQAALTLDTTSREIPEYVLLTDADIEHDVANVRRLVNKALQEDLDLVSVMVRLRCESFWEQLLIPAFVFFFQKLYPFRWVNDHSNATAAAAGGCILIRTAALVRIGGIEVVRQALIDDCALAGAVKRGGGEWGVGSGEWGVGSGGVTPPVRPWGVGDSSLIPHSLVERSDTNSPLPTQQGRIWLGLSDLTKSLRSYPTLGTIWDMVARTAFTQLNYSPLLLLGTLVGMTLVYIVPPVGVVVGGLTGNWLVAAIGLLTWGLMTLAYLPIIRFYKCSLWFAWCLPAIAFLYTLMTLDSALRHWQGRGGGWKGRVYQRNA
ncbi:MAG: glycosyltransferase [Stigonema ocellatum SAG 48.90 = DSM 106950]|nr:glycosyltransferase [Stigonema ocellatum SAG 48.90 = DSM 106950]